MRACVRACVCVCDPIWVETDQTDRKGDNTTQSECKPALGLTLCDTYTRSSSLVRKYEEIHVFQKVPFQRTAQYRCRPAPSLTLCETSRVAHWYAYTRKSTFSRMYRFSELSEQHNTNADVRNF